jgi:LPXTG-motif cell wall-anchored protein
VVGGIVGLALLIAGAIFLVRRKKKYSAVNSGPSYPQETNSEMNRNVIYKHELPASEAAGELQAEEIKQDQQFELQGSTPERLTRATLS